LKHHTEKIIPETTKKIVDKISGDICKREVKADDLGDPIWVDIYVEGFNMAEVEVRIKTGTQLSGTGSGEEVKPDICPKCFEKHIIPFLESLGVNMTPRDWGY